MPGTVTANNTQPQSNSQSNGNMRVIVGGKDYDKFVIPHDIYYETDPNSEYKALTFKEFLDIITSIKQKVVQVNARGDRKFSETEAKQMLKALKKIIPLLNDKKDFLIENKIINSEIEYANLKDEILDITKRQSIKDKNFFIPFRDELPTYTEKGILENGFEYIQTIKSEPAPEVVKEPEVEKAPEKKEESINSESVVEATPTSEPVEALVTVPEAPGRNISENRVFSLAISNDTETLEDLVRLTPLGRRAIWSFLSEDQRKYLNDHPYKPAWNERFNNFAYERFFDPAQRLVHQVDEDMGFKGLRTNIKNAYDTFKENRRAEVFSAADRGNLVADWIKQKYLQFRRERGDRQSIFRLGSYLGGQALRTLVSPITNIVDFVKNTSVVRRAITAFQGVNNFSGKTLNTIGRVGGGIANGMKFAVLPTIVSSLMGMNPLVAAGLFTGIGVAKQAFNSIDLFKSHVGFKLPFIDGPIRRMAILNELRINPQRYASAALDTFAEPNRAIVEEFRANPALAQAGKIFGAAKHLFGALPFASVATGLGFLMTGGNLPLSLMIGGGALAGRAAAGMAIERISGLLGRGLAAAPIFRQIFRMPGMSFLGIADGSNWVKGEVNYIKEKGFGSWVQSQGDTQFNIGPVGVSKGVITGIRSFLLVNDIRGVFKWFNGIASATSMSGSGMVGSLLSKVPLLTRFVTPIAVVSSISLAAVGAISWSSALGIIFGSVATTLTLALFSSTIIGTLVGIPASVIVGHYASKFGNWLGSFFDKTAEVLSDMNIASLIPIAQLGKALYDIVNTSIDDIGDYARIGLISLSIIPAFGILMQLAEQQANANFESGRTTSVSTQTFQAEETASSQYNYDLQTFEYDCEKVEQGKIFFSELSFFVTDIIALNKNGINQYSLKGNLESGETIIFKSMTNINPNLKLTTKVNTGEIIGSC